MPLTMPMLSTSQPCYLRDWEMQVHFKIHGQGKKNLNGDGFALWYTKDRMQTGASPGSGFEEGGGETWGDNCRLTRKVGREGTGRGHSWANPLPEAAPSKPSQTCPSSKLSAK